MQKTRGTALLAASLLVMGGLSACGDEGSSADESSSTTASPSAPEKESSSEESSSGSEASGSESSGSEGGPEGDEEVAELPAAAKKQTKAGAIAFNEFYFDQSGKALESGDTKDLETLSDNCDVCDNFAESVKADAEDGTHMNRNPYAVHSTSARKRPDGGYRVELTLKVSEYSEVLKDGSKGRTAEPTSMKVVTDTQWSAGQWKMRDQVRVQ